MKKYPEDTILLFVKSLYSLAKAENHWFAIYLDHYKEKLVMEILSYDACLLIIKDGSENFGIVRIQTNDTLNVGTEIFINKEETENIEVKFKAKTQTMLKTSIFRDFNSCYKIIETKSIMVVQKNQVEMLVLVNIKDNAKKQQYVKQDAHSVYFTSIC